MANHKKTMVGHKERMTRQLQANRLGLNCNRKSLDMPTSIGQAIHKHFLKRDLFFHTKIDTRLKWLHFASVYIMDLFGIHTRSSWRRQILITATTEAIRYFIADNLKTLTDERRPLPYFDHRSFPSGHTSSSFAGAEFIHQELKESHQLLSYIGYVGATSVAIIRLMKNKHWLKDVVAGAIIGIVATKLAYRSVDRRNHKTPNTGKLSEHSPHKNK